MYPKMDFGFSEMGGGTKLEMKCAICGKPFQTGNALAMYCSKQCKREGEKRRAKAGEKNIKYCKWCGKMFVPNSGTQKFCCPAHVKAAARGKIPPNVIESAKKNKESIEEIVVKAMEMGMSYGEYVGKYQI